jgi:peptidoglycan hydrolase CwlO-like protein
MEMIDILQKLREYQEAGHSVGDAIDNVERTNPTNEGEFKKIATDKAEKERLTKLLKDKKAEYEAAMAGQGSGVGKEEKLEDEIEKIEKELGISQRRKRNEKRNCTRSNSDVSRHSTRSEHVDADIKTGGH